MPQEIATLPTTAGKLLSKTDGQIVLGLIGSDYKLSLAVHATIKTSVNDRIAGTIHAQAQRVDVVGSGGRYVEPMYGRPRRLQGRIIGGDVAGNRIFVACGPTVICTLTDTRQKAGDFAVGQLVGFDIENGATFEPIA